MSGAMSLSNFDKPILPANLWTGVKDISQYESAVPTPVSTAIPGLLRGGSRRKMRRSKKSKKNRRRSNRRRR
jgi:hypothetical protein